MTNFRIPIRTIYQAECGKCGEIKTSSNRTMIQIWVDNHSCAVPEAWSDNARTYVGERIPQFAEVPSRDELRKYFVNWPTEYGDDKPLYIRCQCQGYWIANHDEGRFIEVHAAANSVTLHTKDNCLTEKANGS